MIYQIYWSLKVLLSGTRTRYRNLNWSLNRFIFLLSSKRMSFPQCWELMDQREYWSNYLSSSTLIQTWTQLWRHSTRESWWSGLLIIFYVFILLTICIYRISKEENIVEVDKETRFSEALKYVLVDLGSEKNLHLYDENSVKKYVSLSAAFLRRIEFNTSRIISDDL